MIPLVPEAIEALKQAIAHRDKLFAPQGMTGTQQQRAQGVTAEPRKPVRRAAEVLDADMLFPTSPLALRLAWVRVTKRANLDDLHFHDLRHEAISRLFELGLTVPEVASISGHRTMSQLMRYAHANAQSVRQKLLMVAG